MKNIIKVTLLLINSISFIFLSFVTLFIFYCEIIGYDKGNELLTKIHFPFNDNYLITIGFICVIIMIITCFLRKKFSK